MHVTDQQIARLESFEFDVESTVQQFSFNHLDRAVFRSWLLRQNWPPFDAGSKVCQLASASFWFLKIIERGGPEESYRKMLDTYVMYILHPGERRPAIWSAVVSSTTYASLLAASREHRSK
jgi:hypothetical protein